MQDVLNNTEDLDEDFTPDPDMLGQADKAPAQVMVTKVQKIEEPKVAKPEMTPDQMLAAQLVLVQDNQTKILKLRDIHDAIVAKESINRLDAERVSMACEDFLGPRLKLNEFTAVDSKINYNPARTFLEAKIAREEAQNAELKKTIATESVMEYASVVLSNKANNISISKDNLHDKHSKLALGVYIPHEGAMINLSKHSLKEIEEKYLRSIENKELADSLEKLSHSSDFSNMLMYVECRHTGSGVSDAVSMTAACRNTESSSENFKLGSLFEYLSASYSNDIKELQDNYESMRISVQDDLKTLDAFNGSTVEFVNYITSTLTRFKTLETYEDIIVKLSLSVRLVNAVIESMKY